MTSVPQDSNSPELNLIEMNYHPRWMKVFGTIIFLKIVSHTKFRFIYFLEMKYIENQCLMYS